MGILVIGAELPTQLLRIHCDWQQFILEFPTGGSFYRDRVGRGTLFFRLLTAFGYVLIVKLILMLLIFDLCKGFGHLAPLVQRRILLLFFDIRYNSWLFSLGIRCELQLSCLLLLLMAWHVSVPARTKWMK